MALNIITAKFCSGATQTWTEEAYQWDYGQVLQFEGLELPEAYQVHFSNVPLTGTTITQIGGADGVTVPDQFFLTGETIYAWVYLHEGEDDGETVYMVTIPVKKRPQPSDDVPTPVEQSAIDQAIAALNIAVEKADEAITHYPTIIDGTWHVWDVTEEEYVDTGVQAQGEPGDPGDPGQDGFSPEVTVTDITDGHRVTITDAQGAHTFDVMDGEDAQAVDAGDVAYDATETYPADTVGDAITDVKADLNQKVGDVQVNGTSIVNQGVAGIPWATDNVAGVVKVNPTYGTTLRSSPNQDTIILSKATASNIKNADTQYRPIVPFNQHESTFYGLARAASDTTQSASSNPVGTYTDAAKVAIQKMLGIYEAPWELIREDTVTNATEADVDITVDGNGNPFELTDCLLQFDTPVQETASSKNASVYLYHGIGYQNRFTAETVAWTQAANASAHGAFVSYEQNGELIKIGSRVASVTGNNSNFVYRLSLAAEKASGIYYNNTDTELNIIRAVLLSVTGTIHYRLFGKRAWS